MKTVGEVLALSCSYLKSKNIARARRDVEDLIGSVIGVKRLDLYIQFERPLVEEELTKIRDGVKRLSQSEPLEYILGKAEFYDCTIFVDKTVIIPRPETELLAEKIIHKLKDQDLRGKILLDLCTGPGSIGIVLKKHLPDLRVLLSDISEEVIQLAKKNAKENRVEVEFLVGDLFEPLKATKINFLVCNPPYISDAEYEGLDLSVKDFEPHRALVSGKSGFEFYERIAGELRERLLPEGFAWFEIGSTQGEKVKEIFSKAGFTNIILEKDLAGLDRIIELF